VAVATAFYFTWDLSLHSALTKLISCSGKVAQVAQPLLDKIANQPTIGSLSSTRLLILTPVVIKLVHIALAAHSTKLGACMNKISQGIECLLHARFALICLEHSTASKSMILRLLWPYLTSPEKIGALATSLGQKLLPSHIITIFQTNMAVSAIVTIFMQRSNSGPGWGLYVGLQSMLEGIRSSEPYDVATLETLFNGTQSEDPIQILAKIDIALAEEKIGPTLASWLEESIPKPPQRQTNRI
jgi:hypothetical protein